MGGLLSLQSALYPQPSYLKTLAALNVPAVFFPTRWVAVRERFEEFHRNLVLTPLQQLDGHAKRGGVVSCLNRAYYGTSADTQNSFLIGSWGKNTCTRPLRDVDICFLLPVAVFHRFQNYAGNRQSALLQEVKNILAATYHATDMSGDGQVVVVNFSSYCVEVAPAFELTTAGRYWICEAHNGGSYKEMAPWSEVQHVDAVDKANAGNLRPLIRMLKAWQAWNSVPIKSFQLELLVAEFIAQSQWRLKDWFYFDWVIADFFAFLYRCANRTILVPGTFETIYLGNAWHSRAESAYHRAVKACAYEYDNNIAKAGGEWQKIFGSNIPRVL